MTYRPILTQKSNKITEVDGTLVQSQASSATTLSDKDLDTTFVTENGDGFVYEATLTSATNSNAKGIKIQVDGVDIIDEAAITSINADPILIRFTYYKKDATNGRYLCELHIMDRTPTHQASDDVLNADFLKAALNFKVISDTAVAVADIVLNGVTMSKLEIE